LVLSSTSNIIPFNILTCFVSVNMVLLIILLTVSNPFTKYASNTGYILVLSSPNNEGYTAVINTLSFPSNKSELLFLTGLPVILDILFLSSNQ